MGDQRLGELKGRMVNNSNALIGQKNQLDGIKTIGMEAHDNLKDAGRELSRQGTEL